MKTFFKKQKEKFVKWLLKEYYVGFYFHNNEFTNCSFDKNIFSIETFANIILEKTKLEDDVEIIIKKKQ